MALNLEGRFKVKGYNGVAFRISGFPKVWEPWTTLVVDEEGNEYEGPTGEGEWNKQDESCGRVLVVMVGDDHKYEVDVSDLTEIDEEEYCPECGQIGCHAIR